MKFSLDPSGCIGVYAIKRVIREKGREVPGYRRAPPPNEILKPPSAPRAAPIGAGQY